jgi:hypothetical protein
MAVVQLAGRVAVLGAILTLLAAASAPVRVARSFLVPAPDNPPEGTELKVKPGGNFVTSSIMVWNYAVVKAARDVSAHGLTQSYVENSKLKAYGATQESRISTGLSSSIYFCGEPFAATKNFAESLVPKFLRDFESYVAFCFSDEDVNGDLDHFFISGAKNEEMLRAIRIDPLRFSQLPPIENINPNRMRIMYKRASPSSQNILIYLRMFGKKSEYISSKFKYWGPEKDKNGIIEAKLNMKYNADGPTELPNIFGYNITIIRVDPKTKEISYRYTKSVRPVYFESTF